MLPYCSTLFLELVYDEDKCCINGSKLSALKGVAESVRLYFYVCTKLFLRFCSFSIVASFVFPYVFVSKGYVFAISVASFLYSRYISLATTSGSL